MSSTAFVLVPGACHGGWWFDPVVSGLEAAGHRPIAVTLTGLDPLVEATPGVNLDDHIAQLAQIVGDRAERSEHGQVVLVGHSYAGLVMTAVADRHPELCAALVYLDAHVPTDGESCFSLTNHEQRRWFLQGSAGTGTEVTPLPFFDSRARPHPLGSLLQRVSLTDAWRSVPVRHYVEATQGPDPSPFATSRARVASETGWTTHRWPTRHNVLHEGPDRVLELLLDVAARMDRDRDRDRATVGVAQQAESIALGNAGASLTVLLSRDMTAGATSVYRWHLADSSRGPDPHYHLTYGEGFTVESGHVDFFDGEQWHALSAGDAAYARPGAIHAIKKNNDQPASLLLLLTPGTPREDYFQALGALTNPTDQEIAQLHQEHDNHYV